SALAFQDGLTGVKNKNAHAEKVMLLNRQIHDGMARFAVIMADVNNLKTINDGQGHAEGDRAIRGVCLRLCHVIAHSPVFRIGGDEFVAIAEGPDYDNRDALYNSLVEDHFTDETHTFSFSSGMATFDPAVDKDFASVFERADDQMYEVKKKIKEGMKKPE
ncbi:MAG: GGDEF domain-containing protein, partial [Bacilli bacterium]|nr:GGDEF domain-containing protein [Bacilli bacterium]